MGTLKKLETWKIKKGREGAEAGVGGEESEEKARRKKRGEFNGSVCKGQHTWVPRSRAPTEDS